MTQNLKDVLVAIAAVKRRAVAANREGDFPAYRERMDELIALNICLDVEAQKLVDFLDAQATYLIDECEAA